MLKFTKNQNSEPLELPKMTFLNRLNSPKIDFTYNWSGGKMIKFQQSEALTSHFESLLEHSAQSCKLVKYFGKSIVISRFSICVGKILSTKRI